MKKIIFAAVILISNLAISQEDKIYKMVLKNKTTIEVKNPKVVINSVNYETLEGNSNIIETSKIENIEGFDFVPNVKIQKLSHNDFKNKNLMEIYNDGNSIGKYTDVNGDTYKKGDTLVIGKPSGISSNYNQTTGLTSKVFETIMYGTGAGAMLKGIRFADNYLSGQKIIIDEILLFKRGNSAYVYTIPIDEKILPVDKFLTVSLDKALATKEIINPKGKLTKETAIALLKEKKELLDLGLISQAEYDKLKAELSPIILNK